MTKYNRAITSTNEKSVFFAHSVVHLMKMMTDSDEKQRKGIQSGGGEPT